MSIASKLAALGLVGAIGGVVGYGISNSNTNKELKESNNIRIEQEAEISDLRNSLNEKTATIVLLESKVEELNSKLNAKEIELEAAYATSTEKDATITNLEAEIETLNEQIQTLQSQLDELQKISFTVLVGEETLEFNAKEGMTWGEWVESSFNTNNYTINDFGEIEVDNILQTHIFDGDIHITADMTINNGTSYTSKIYIPDPVIAPLEFEVAGIKYQAESDMTWDEWLESEYSLESGLSVDSEGYIVSDNLYLFTDGAMEQVKASDVIVENQLYYLAELTLTNVTSLATVNSDISDWFNDPSKVVDGDITTGNSSSARSNSMSYTFEFEDILEIYKVKVYMNSGGTATDGTTHEAGATPIPKMQITAYNMNDEVFNSGEIDTSDMTILETFIQQEVNKVVITILQVGYSHDKVIYEVELFSH